MVYSKMKPTTVSFDIETIPLEVWELILGKLSLRDLCRVISTSRHLNCLASHPSMWANMGVSKWKIQEECLASLFSINRFTRTRKINLSGMRFTTEELENMFEVLLLSRVEELDLREVDLSQVNPDLLASTIARLRKASLKFNRLTTEQMTAILTSSLQSQTLEDLVLHNIELSTVDPELLAKAVGHLKTVDLTNICVHNNVLTAILEASLTSSSLTSLNLCGNDLSRVDSQLLARAISCLVKVDLTDTKLSTTQWEAILASCTGSNKMQEIVMEGTDLSLISAPILARAICSLPAADLSNTQLTTAQCSTILAASLEASSKLKEINLQLMTLSEVPAELMARAFQGMNKINLYNTSLTVEQCNAILISSLDSKTLRDIYIQSPNLKMVSPDLLAKAVSRLYKVNLTHNVLTTEHWESILTSSLSSTTLKEMSINCVDLSAISPTLLASALSHLCTVSIMDSSLTSDQSIAILKSIPTSSTLETLNLFLVDLSEVDEVLLATSLARLRQLHLGRNYMSSQQCAALLSASIHSTSLTTLEITDMDMIRNEENQQILRKAKQKFSHLYELDMDQSQVDQGCQIC